MTRKNQGQHECSIAGCGRRFTRGGRAGKDGKPKLCPMHYHRELRGSPAATVAGATKTGKPRRLVGFRPSAEVAAALKRYARQVKPASMGALVEDLVRASLVRAGALS